jgi:hypothetical protein
VRGFDNAISYTMNEIKKNSEMYPETYTGSDVCRLLGKTTACAVVSGHNDDVTCPKEDELLAQRLGCKKSPLLHSSSFFQPDLRLVSNSTGLNLRA